MKYYRYIRVVEGGFLKADRISEEEILKQNWNHWSRKMTEKLGPDHEDITEENCIAEWISDHSSAWELPEDEE